MATVVSNEGSVFITEEITEGTYVAESSGSEVVEVLADGLEITPARELLERNNRTDSVEKVAARAGQRSVSGTIPTELKAGDSEGSAPDSDLLWKALLGGKRTGTASTSKASPAHTSTVIQIEDADISKYAVGDVVLVKESGAYELRPISAINSGAGVATITFPFALDNGAPSASVVIGAFTTYYVDSTNAPSLSVTNYLGGVLRQKAIGMRPISGEISNFSTGQLAEVAFGMEGLTFEKETGTPVASPTFGTALPPVILSSKVFQEGTEMVLNEFGVSIANTLGFKTSTADANGKISSRITNIDITGTMNPYQDSASVALWDKFDDNTELSIFAETGNPSTTAGETSENIGIYMPTCRITEAADGDADGLMTDEFSFMAHRNLGNDSFFISFS